jgi:hypothetical protein
MGVELARPKNGRYQDLSREQAFGVEARTLLRAFPLLLHRPHCQSSDIDRYFRDLFKLVYLLCDVSLGNTEIAEARSPAEELHKSLNRSNLFLPKSIHAAEAILCVTDALAQLNRVSYFPAPGLADRDQRNPDLAMLVSMTALTLSQIGMQEEVFSHPSQVDCGFVMASRADLHPYVTVDFFARDLWPTPGLFSPDVGMPPAFRMAILESWEESLESIGLAGLVASYNGVLRGMHLQQKNIPARSEARTVINNVTLNFDNGSTFTGPLAVGENIRIAYRAAADVQNDELKTRLESVVAQVSKLIETIQSEEAKNDVSAQLQSFVQEAKKEKPSKKLLSITSDGLIEAAKSVAAFAGPVAAAVKAVMTLIA